MTRPHDAEILTGEASREDIDRWGGVPVDRPDIQEVGNGWPCVAEDEVGLTACFSEPTFRVGDEHVEAEAEAVVAGEH